MSLLAFFATLALFAGASADKPCCGPEKFSAETIVKTYMDGSFYQGTGLVYYDYLAGMHVGFVNLTIDEFKGVFSLTSVHFNHNTGMVYIMVGGHCQVEKLDDFKMKMAGPPHCVPSDAVLDSTFDLGGPNEALGLRYYKLPIPGGQRQTTVTNTHCFLVQENLVIGHVTKNGFNMTLSTMMTMTNLKLSVDDPSIFTLPKMCTKAPMYTTRNNDKNLPVDPLMFVPYLASL